MSEVLSVESGSGGWVRVRLSPFFSYYGSKHRIAGRYPHPVTGHVMEPFAGSAAYACQYPQLAVTLCETNPKVAGVWDFLIRAPESEIRALPLIDPDTLIADLPLRSGISREAVWHRSDEPPLQGDLLHTSFSAESRADLIGEER